MDKAERIAKALFYSRYNPAECPKEHKGDIDTIKRYYTQYKTGNVTFIDAIIDAQAKFIKELLA